MIKSVVFDIDGVLLDSFDSNLQFMSDVLEHFGYKRLSREEYQKVFHYTFRDVITEFSELTSSEEINKIVEYGLAIYHSKGYNSLMKMPENAGEMIISLSKKYSLGIVTSRVRKGVFIPQLLPYKKYFQDYVCLEDTEKHKPDPEPLLLIAKKLAVHPNEAVYIGDAESDMLAAESAGMKRIFFSNHTFPNNTLSTNNFSQLANLIAGL